MAVSCKVFRSFSPFINSSSLWNNCKSIRYSSYSPTFQDPVFDKNKIAKLLEEKKPEELKFILRKAPKNYETCSVFYNEILAKFTNVFMRKGQREKGREKIEKAFTLIKHFQLRKYNAEKDDEKKKEILIRPLDVFLKAVENATPVVTLKRVRKSGTWYKVPTNIYPQFAQFMAMRWIIQSAKDKNNKIPIEKTLAMELLNASQYEGKAIGKKVELHKLCEANRSYAHLRSS